MSDSPTKIIERLAYDLSVGSRKIDKTQPGESDWAALHTALQREATPREKHFFQFCWHHNVMAARNP